MDGFADVLLRWSCFDYEDEEECGVEIKCHKAILSSRSEHFRRLLQADKSAQVGITRRMPFLAFLILKHLGGRLDSP